jgi:hypothetical protein
MLGYMYIVSKYPDLKFLNLKFSHILGLFFVVLANDVYFLNFMIFPNLRYEISAPTPFWASI